MQKRTANVTDQSGAVIAGAQVAVYIAGTTTLATLYSDNGVTPRANPIVVVPSDGSYTYYAANGRYSEVISASGFTFGGSQTNDLVLFDPQSNEFNVKDAPYYAKGDNSTDDTAAILAAITAAGAAAQSLTPAGGQLVGTVPLVVFPSGIYKISDHLVPTSGYVRIAGRGNPIINQTNAAKDIFDFSGGYIVTVRGLSLVGGRAQVRFCNNNLEAAKLLVDEVEFHRNNSAPMVEFYLSCSGAGNLSTQATIRDSKMMQPYQAASTVLGVSLSLQNVWVEPQNTGATPPTMVDGALFVNKTDLFFERVYGVPPTASTNARWIDNYGVFQARNSRFGCEGGGGLPIVYNFAGPGQGSPPLSTSSMVVFKGSQICMGPSANANAGIIRAMTDLPQSIIIENNFFADQEGNHWMTIDSGCCSVGGTGSGAFTNYLNTLVANTRIWITVRGNQAWVPLHAFGYPASLCNTDQQKVVCAFDEPDGMKAVVYSSTPPIDPAIAKHFLIVPTDGNAFTVTLSGALPGGVYPTWAGQVLTVTVKNTFGALGAISHGTGFKGTAWTAPANGNSRSKTFRYDGTNWVQISETTADVPN